MEKGKVKCSKCGNIWDCEGDLRNAVGPTCNSGPSLNSDLKIKSTGSHGSAP